MQKTFVKYALIFARPAVKNVLTMKQSIAGNVQRLVKNVRTNAEACKINRLSMDFYAAKT